MYHQIHSNVVVVAGIYSRKLFIVEQVFEKISIYVCYFIHGNLSTVHKDQHNRLSATYREAIVLKYFDFPTATDAEIAERLGISENAFFKRRKLGLLALKNFFEN